MSTRGNAESGDFLMARDEGVVTDDHIVASLGDLLIPASRSGRLGEDDITLFISLGLGVEDLAAASLVYRNAIRDGAGTPISIGGQRNA